MTQENRPCTPTKPGRGGGLPAIVRQLRRELRAALRENDRVLRAVKRAACPWTACCLEHRVATRKGGDVYRVCWRAEALGYVLPQDGGPPRRE